VRAIRGDFPQLQILVCTLILNTASNVLQQGQTSSWISPLSLGEYPSYFAIWCEKKERFLQLFVDCLGKFRS